MWEWRHLRRPYTKGIREQFVNWIYWHLTFMWPLIAVGLVYVPYQICSGNYHQVLFSAKDLPGVWPMVCHYFLFGPKPELKEYNPLQNFAYTIAIFLGTLAVLSGLVLYKPVQLFGLAWLVGGHGHFAVMLGLVSFIPGHLIMVMLHGWSNFYSMLIVLNKNSEPVAAPSDPAQNP